MGQLPGIALEIPFDEISEVCRRHRVRELALFGSALRSDFRAESDVDLLVEFEPDAQVGMLALARVQRELSEVLHRQVDLVPKRGLKGSIRESILDNARVLFAN